MESEGFVGQNGVIRIDKEGKWFYNELPIINKSVYLFFNRHIIKDAAGGYSLLIGSDRCKLIVEDTPYVVVDISLVPDDTQGEGSFIIRLNDETEEKLALETVYINHENIPYCRVKNGEFPARFLRVPYYRFAEHVQQEGEDRFYILLNTRKFYITVHQKKEGS